MHSRVLLIIPAFNEEMALEKTMSRVIASGYDYIIINDGSTDNTKKIIDKNHYNHINLITNLGIGGAVQTGYRYAYENSYDIAIQFDADGQHDLKYLPDLISPIQNKEANLTIGSCFIDKKNKKARSSKIRRLGIRFLSLFIYTFSGKHIYDPTSGFRAADSEVIKYFAYNYPLEYPEPVSNFELLKHHRKIKIKEVPVVMEKRTAGKSSIRSWKSAYAAINVVLSILILSSRRKKHD